MTTLPPHRECRQHWQRACELILEGADVAEEPGPQVATFKPKLPLAA
jgi:hypothetical protein